MDYLKIIENYYGADDALRCLLLRHSRDVCNLALRIVDAHPELDMDRKFVEEGAMVHDLGIFLTDAPGIHCHGKDPYILHGWHGGQIMRREGFPNHARVCERHTGTGITKREIEEKGLPLPPQDWLPETFEEQLICYADKFFSKSHPERFRTTEQALKSVSKHGPEGVATFLRWTELFKLT